jgi:hypothetical protein
MAATAQGTIAATNRPERSLRGEYEARIIGHSSHFRATSVQHPSIVVDRGLGEKKAKLKQPLLKGM